MLNIVIPMAGAGSRFANAGYTDPKPLIPVHGKPMIQVVVENLRPACPHRFIFICQRAHVLRYDLQNRLRQFAPGCEIVQLDELTDGAARTVLSARYLINDESPLMIANSDQYVSVDINEYLTDMSARDLDGLIMTMTASDPKWSFAEVDDQQLVTRVVEKEVISDLATVGIYNFKCGADFVRGAEEMISRGLTVNNEYYVAPVYNILIEDGFRSGVWGIGSENAGMYGLGIPVDLQGFLSLPWSHDAVWRENGEVK
jgi:dTDP-glucose pyrophosphorylase